MKSEPNKQWAGYCLQIRVIVKEYWFHHDKGYQEKKSEKNVTGGNNLLGMIADQQFACNNIDCSGKGTSDNKNVPDYTLRAVLVALRDKDDNKYAGCR